MAKEVKKDPSELSVEEKLRALYQLQTMLSEIDKIKTLRGELPLEVQDLEDEVTGLSTRIEKIKTEMEALNGRIPGLLSLKIRLPLPASSTGDILLESILTGEEALAGYQTHPDHLKAAAFVRSVTENRVCADCFL